jgi:hypothetical protein
LRIEVNGISVLRAKTIEQFRQGALGAVLTVHERRNYGDVHVSQLVRVADGRFFAEVVRMGARLNIPQKSLSDIRGRSRRQK